MRLLIKLPENVSKNTSIEKNLRATLFNLLIGQLPFFMRLPTAASIITCQSWTCIKIHWTKLSLSSLKYQWLLSGCCLSVFGGHANHGNMLLQFIRYLIAEQSRQGKRHESYSELKKKRRIWMDTRVLKRSRNISFIYRRDHVTLSLSSLFVSWSTYEH